MVANISGLKTDATLLEALEKTASKRLTAEEVLEQRISFVFGSMGSDSNVTRQYIRQVIEEQEGKDVE